MARGIYGQAFIHRSAERGRHRALCGSHPLASNPVQDPIILPAYRAIAQHLGR
jgi:hypothetical protein